MKNYLDAENKFIGRFKYPNGYTAPEPAEGEDPIVIFSKDIAPANSIALDDAGTDHFYDGDDYIGGFGDGATPPIGSLHKDAAPVYVPSAKEIRRKAINAELDDDDFKELMLAWAKANPDDVPPELKPKLDAING